ncbi:hypothetical protein SSP35_23_00640 [Streptomyces sp. NBRC 110611]|uniref:hypothetical protein n=1 Tax=Streptomyces sp. NBRC 110611 TaxID=1621259 RepID=UPI00082B3D80|nr:hypothetical protein [Streptomyces sp. NBRC 110611]GAU70874.1 hypothetical protein SSP35_23_00640 [Streptomyces sp. NBRC 110611]
MSGRTLAAAVLILPASALAAPDANGTRPGAVTAVPPGTAGPAAPVPVAATGRTHRAVGRCRPLPPAADPGTATLAQARVLARCLTSADGGPRPQPNGPTAAGERGGDTSVAARTLRVTGLLCPLPAPTGALCRARSVTLQGARIVYGAGSGICLSAPTVTARGDIRLAARWISGRLLGLLPVGFPTSLLPPVPVPYAALTDVRIAGLRLRAGEVTAVHGRITPGSECFQPAQWPEIPGGSPSVGDDATG